MSKFLKALISATLAAVSLTTIQQTVAQATPGPFGCTPDFYQASNGDMYHLDISSYQYTTMPGNSNVNGLNAIGYNTADNFIYGIDGNSDLVKVFDDGSHSAPIATTGVTPKGTGGTFIAPNRMLTSNTSGSFTTLDLGTNPPTVADFTDTGTAWAAADIAFYPALKTAYGLDGNTLYVATFDSGLTTLDVTTKTFTNNFNSRDAWGAAYVDRDGNGYFFDNATSDLYEVPAASLQSASATITATLLNASTTLSSPNDGASCPDAVAPMAATPSPTPTPSAQPPAPTYPVYFDGNGGGPNPPTQSYNSNICFALPDGPSRPGYTFVGWFVAPDAHSLLPSPYCPTGDSGITLYAHWTPNSYLLNYNSAGGSVVPSATYTHGSSVTLAGAPTRAGYTFAGWAVSPDGGATVASPYAAPAGGATLYARWTANNYVLKYDSQGGTEVPASTFQTGGSVNLAAAPTRPGYSFIGWFGAAKDGSPLASPHTPGVTNDVTVFAQWKPNGYKVTFDAQGGSPVADGTYQTAGCLDLPAAPARDGYTFTGWFAAATGGSSSASPLCPTDLGDLTLYAQWTKNPPVKRPPVTVTISGFADGSPVLTKAIKKQIDAFLKKYSDYKNVECIGYTEGPTVLKTDYALSRSRATNSCNYAVTQAAGGIGKSLRKLPSKAGQETVEASHLRRVTITLTD